MTESMLSSHPRRRSLAELDARIVQAEGIQAQRHAEVQANPVGKRATVLASVAMHLADERLALLRGSRAVLIGKPPRDRL